VTAGGGKAAVLAAMRERAPGYFGILTLIIVFAVKLGALSVLSGRGAAAAQVAAEAAAWAIVPALLHYLDPAIDRGLAARAGRPRFEEAALAAAFGAAVALLFLGPWTGIIALAVGAAAAFKIAWLARRAVGGVTGAVLGAGHQAVVTGVLIAAAALM
jgi:adenosylcobinamide-GDP ribazoletransferase